MRRGLVPSMLIRERQQEIKERGFVNFFELSSFGLAEVRRCRGVHAARIERVSFESQVSQAMLFSCSGPQRFRRV